MKKLLIILCTLFVTLSLAACGNMSMNLGNFSFEHIHFSNGIEGHCATVEKWHDNDIGVEVKTNEYGALYLAEGTYSLFESGNKCPYCQ